MVPIRSCFHLHLVSDATGETLIAAGRAVSSQFASIQVTEHVYPMVRNQSQLDKIVNEITHKPGIVLYTMINKDLICYLENQCKRIGSPCISILKPVFQTFQKYLGMQSDHKVGAQHVLDSQYFNRIDALNFAMMHDDGFLPEDIDEPDIILIGISRTSKTPTSIYLANRGIKVINIPLILGRDLPKSIFNAKIPLIVGLIATKDRIYQIRKNRMLDLNVEPRDNFYSNRVTIAEELTYTRNLCNNNNWPMIDVSRKSIEETAAAILALQKLRKRF